jgi:hypothetical protein
MVYKRRNTLSSYALLPRATLNVGVEPHNKQGLHRLPECLFYNQIQFIAANSDELRSAFYYINVRVVCCSLCPVCMCSLLLLTFVTSGFVLDFVITVA